ncbi:MAG: ABC transporter substrate-binding protein [Dehalococcoidaceae bacterium]|nr:ABC transporter substrate-binding protein [Dehalococcoidaceae bacterium]
MKNRFMVFIVGLLVMIFAPVSLGCGADSEKPTVKIVMAPYFGSWLCTYGITSGEVASDEVEVTIDLSLKFDDQMMAGNYPIGAMNTAAFAIGTELASFDLKALGVYLAHTGLEVTDGVALVYVKPGSSLSSPADLAGKKVGVPGLNSGTASTFLGLLKTEYGIEENQITLVDNAPPQLLEFLRKGDIDATLVLGDPSVQAYASGEFQVFWNVDQAFEARYGTYNPASFLAVRADYAAANPETTRAVYELLLQSRDWGEERLEELSEIYVAEYGGNAAFYQNAYTRHYSVTFDGVEGALEDGVMAIFGFVKDRGIISSIPEPEDIFVKW